MALKFRRGTTAQQSGSLAFGEPYVNTTLGTLLIGGPDGDIILGSSGTGSIGNFGAISGSGLDITGNANIAGNLTLGGAITIGDASSDTINVIASVSSSIIPSIANTFDLGSEDYFWRDIYVSTGSIKFVGAAGNIVGTLTNRGDGLNLDAGIVTNGNSSFGTSSLAITSITGSLRVSGSITTIGASTATSFNGTINATNGVVSGSSQVIGILSSLNTFSGSQLTQNTALATITGSLITSASTAKTTNDTQDGRLTNIETFSGSALTRLTALEVETSNLETFSGSTIGRLNNLETTSASVNTSITNLNSTTASLTQRVAANEAVSGTFARTNSNNTFSGLQSFNNINVEGTASFAYIQSTTGSSTSIGEAFILLNESTPSSNFAGIKVVDSGSSFTTASFVYDGLNNNWVFEHEGSVNSGSSLAIFGPLSQGGLGTEVGLTENRIPKAVTTHGHHIADSQITDDGTTITLGSNTVVTGTIVASGTTLVSGSSQITYASISSIPAGIVSGSSQVTPLLPSGVISGSSQVNADSITNFDTNVKDKLNTDLVVSGSASDVKTFLSLQNVTNESKATMFASPTFTGTVAGVTATHVGLGNVTNESKATMFSSPTFTGTVSGVTATHVGLGNVTNTSDANKPVSTAQQTALDAKLNINGAGVVSGSSQITLSSTTGYGSVINQNLLTTSNVQHASLGIGMAATGTAGRIDAANDIVAFSTSDIRLKENIQPIENAIDKIRKISGNTYDWKSELKDIHGYEGNDVGVIAQEVEAVLPQLVQNRDNGYKAVKYDKLVALLIEGIKEQQLQIEQLRIDLNNCRNKGL